MAEFVAFDSISKIDTHCSGSFKNDKHYCLFNLLKKLNMKSIGHLAGIPTYTVPISGLYSISGVNSICINNISYSSVRNLYRLNAGDVISSQGLGLYRLNN